MPSRLSGQLKYHPNPNRKKPVENALPRSCVYLPVECGSAAPGGRFATLDLLHGVGDTEYPGRYTDAFPHW